MLGFRKQRLRVNLALQGGGAHGAFTWGVLDQLLEDTDIEFGWISGTSAGAINAVGLVAGLADGGPAAAHEKLRLIWESVHESGVADLLRLNPFLYGISRSHTMEKFGALFSPYEFNPLGFDPLRKLLDEHIDFAKVRAFAGAELLIAATDVATGRVRRFRRHELTMEAILASTCLPQLHHAVEIEGRAYWDGGFSANPDLAKLAAESPVGDTLLVLLNPIEKAEMPRTARDITMEVSRVTFSQPLLRDIEEIASAMAAPKRSFWQSGAARTTRLQEHRYHMIEAGRHTSALPADSKMRPDRDMLRGLHAAGRDEARKWLGRHREAIGRQSSVDLVDKFLAPLRPFANACDTSPFQPETEAATIAEKL